MTTYTTYSSDGTTIADKSGANAGGMPRYSVIFVDVDFSKRNVTAADVVKVLNIPANTFVQSVYVRAVLGEASQTVSIGDGDDPDGYLVGADVGTTGNTACSALALTNGTNETITGYTAGKYYSAADTIDVLVPSGKAYTTLKLRIEAAVILYG